MSNHKIGIQYADEPYSKSKSKWHRLKVCSRKLLSKGEDCRPIESFRTRLHSTSRDSACLPIYLCVRLPRGPDWMLEELGTKWPGLHGTESIKSLIHEKRFGQSTPSSKKGAQEARFKGSEIRIILRYFNESKTYLMPGTSYIGDEVFEFFNTRPRPLPFAMWNIKTRKVYETTHLSLSETDALPLLLFVSALGECQLNRYDCEAELTISLGTYVRSVGI